MNRGTTEERTELLERSGDAYDAPGAGEREGDLVMDAVEYDPEGFDANGFDRDGYDHEGFDADGYDVDGYDADGNPAAWLTEGTDENPPRETQTRERSAPNLSRFAEMTGDLSDEEREILNAQIADGDVVGAMQSLIDRNIRRVEAGNTVATLQAQRVAVENPEFYSDYAPGIQSALRRMGSQQAASEEGLAGAVMGAVLADALSGKGWQQALIDAAERLQGSGSRQTRPTRREETPPQAPRRPQAPRVAPRAARPSGGASQKSGENRVVSTLATLTGQDERTVRRNLQQDGRL